MKDFFRKHIPEPIRKAFRVGKKYLLEDAIDFVRGRPPLDPVTSIGGGSEYVDVEFFSYIRDYGALEPEHCVLDIGCGVGRLAIPLTKYLSRSGSYNGFDIAQRSIEWCNNKITARHPNFRFHFADIWNKDYNPSGTLKATDFRFPYSDGRFNFVFSTSVFTHMLHKDVEHYLSEISRVLKPGGRCLITWFLLNDESKQLIECGKSSLKFAYPVEGGLTVNPNVPEIAIAYDEAHVLELYAREGIRLSCPIHYGSWCGRTEYLSYKDICIGHKTGRM